ncbi:MAG: GNAT family N-acetyltransferase [Armatimonadota bacterium]|nr:GNAT family N-acetyltransferase [Armatimonadota bacterium]
MTIRLLLGERSEMAELQRVIEEAPTYAQLVTGVPPGPADAQSTFTILPEGKTYEDKFVFGIYRGSEMVGCADLIRGYPDAATAYLGLLLVSEKHQDQGIGRLAFHLLEESVRGWRTCDRIRTAVVWTNDRVIPFLKGLGFEPTGEIKPYRYGSVASESILFEKSLDLRLPNTGLERAGG